MLERSLGTKLDQVEGKIKVWDYPVYTHTVCTYTELQTGK